MKVILRYRTPVEILVDLDAKTIDRVVVRDDLLEPAVWGAYTEDGENFSDVDDVYAANAVVRDIDVDWPAWDFGW